MALSSNNNSIKQIATKQVGIKPGRLWRRLTLIILAALMSNIPASAEPFSGVVLTPIAESMTGSLDVSPTYGSSITLHHFDLSCSMCHDQSRSSNTSGPQSKLDDIGHVDINRSCASFGCHNYDRDLNHPVGVPAGTTSSSDMPLDKNGRITCLTCHLQPKPDNMEPVENAINERMLHTSKDGDSCQACHSSPIGGATQVHWQFSQKAHLGNINDQPDNSSDGFSFNSDIDAESETCVGCHDEVTVTVPGLFETKAQKKMRYSKMKDHPIGMEYSAIVSREAGRYINSHSISDKIRLFDGRLGCGSCHSLYSDKESLLIVKHVESELCRECHVR